MCVDIFEINSCHPHPHYQNVKVASKSSNDNSNCCLMLADAYVLFFLETFFPISYINTTWTKPNDIMPVFELPILSVTSEENGCHVNMVYKAQTQ